MKIGNEQATLVGCLDCDDKAVWIIETKYTGLHAYCARCAEKQHDFAGGRGWKKSKNGFFYTEEGVEEAKTIKEQRNNDEPI